MCAFFLFFLSTTKVRLFNVDKDVQCTFVQSAFLLSSYSFCELAALGAINCFSSNHSLLLIESVSAINGKQIKIWLPNQNILYYIVYKKLVDFTSLFIQHLFSFKDNHLITFLVCHNAYKNSIN